MQVVFCDEPNIFITEPHPYLKLLAINSLIIPLHLDSCIEQCINVTNRKYDVLGFCETRLMMSPVISITLMVMINTSTTETHTVKVLLSIYVKLFSHIYSMIYLCSFLT